MNIKKRLIALTAALLLCCSGCGAAGAPAGTPAEEQTPAENGSAAAKDTLTMYFTPRGEQAWNACAVAAMTGQVRLHNNESLMKLVAAKEKGETAVYTDPNVSLNGIPATCEVMYDGFQYRMTLRIGMNGMQQEMVLHFQTLKTQNDSSGMGVNVVLLDCTDPNTPIPGAVIGTYWTQEMIDQVDAIYFAK